MSGHPTLEPARHHDVPCSAVYEEMETLQIGRFKSHAATRFDASVGRTTGARFVVAIRRRELPVFGVDPDAHQELEEFVVRELLQPGKRSSPPARLLVE